MNEQNLVPFRTVEEAREKGRMGGLARTERKRLASQLSALKRKKCVNCNLPCPVKDQLMEKDLDSTCQMNSVIKGMLTFQTKDDMLNQIKKYLTIYAAKVGSDEKKALAAIYVMLNIKREFMPEVQRIESKNLNVTTVMQDIDQKIKEGIINARVDRTRESNVH